MTTSHLVSLSLPFPSFNIFSLSFFLPLSSCLFSISSYSCFLSLPSPSFSLSLSLFEFISSIFLAFSSPLPHLTYLSFYVLFFSLPHLSFFLPLSHSLSFFLLHSPSSSFTLPFSPFLYPNPSLSLSLFPSLSFQDINKTNLLHSLRLIPRNETQ